LFRRKRGRSIEAKPSGFEKATEAKIKGVKRGSLEKKCRGANTL